MWKTSDEDATECKLYYNLMLIGTENLVSNRNIKIYLSSFDGEGVKKLNRIKIYYKSYILKKYF